MTTKHTLIASLAVLTCSAALAQAPAGVGKTPAEVSPSASGGAAATSAQNKVDNTKANSSVAVAKLCLPPHPLLFSRNFFVWLSRLF